MSETGSKITLLLADDHALVLRGLRDFLATAADIEIVSCATGGHQAIELAQRFAPDVILLDLLMPDLPAVETIRAVKKASPRTQVIILTSHEGDEFVVPTTQAGAISYVLKDCSPRDLIAAVRRAARGEATVSPRVAQAILGILSKPKPAAALHDDLTERELQVLHEIAAGKANSAIAVDLAISEKTVKSHVSNILSKLYLTDRTQAAVYAWRSGLVQR